jgi:S1-C subfamily serine protease
MTLKSLEGRAELVERSNVEALQELGAEFRTLTAEQADEYGVEGGVQVVRTFAGKFRQQGVRPGFVITSIAGKAVRSMEDLTEIVQSETGGVLVEGIYPDNPDEKQYYGMPL